MRRGELLSLPELKVSEKMKTTVREDKGHQVTRYRKAPIDVYDWYWFCGAKKTKEVLEIDVFVRGMILEGIEYPEYRIFLLEDNRYYTYCNSTEKWITAGIDNLEYPRRYKDGVALWYSDRYIWTEEKDRKKIAKFCNNGLEEPRAAVSRWQKYSKNRRELDEIDSQMALVPELPKDFDKFVDKEVLPQFIFYDAGKNVKEGYCTHCERDVDIKKPRYGTEGRCPRCKAKIVYKSRKKSGSIQVKAYAGLLQKTPEGYIYRYFECYRNYQNGQKEGGGYWETIRTTYTPDFRKRNDFEFWRYKQTDWERWCFKRETEGWYGWYSNIPEYKAILYNRNLKQILKGSPMQYSGIEQYAKHGNDREQLRVGEYIFNYRYHRGLEQLVKCGFYKLAAKLIENGGGSYLDTQETKCKKILGVGAEYYKMLQGKNPTVREYEVAYEANAVKVRLTWQQVQYFARFHCNFAIYIRHTTAHKMQRYMQEVLRSGKEITQEYHDYLQMAAGLGYNLRDEWVLYPKELKKRHAELVEEQREREEELDAIKDAEKDVAYKRIRKREAYLEMETEQYLLRLPKKINEIRQEGNAMHHCVATYIDRVAKGETTILFLRQKERPEEPFYTMEVRDGEVIQCRAKYNGEMTEEVKQFVELFKKTKLQNRERKVG